MSNVGAQNRFLQSNLTNNGLASELTLKKVCDNLESGLTVSGAVTVSNLNDPHNVQTSGLSNKVQCAMAASDITGDLPVVINNAADIDVNLNNISTATGIGDSDGTTIRTILASDQPDIAIKDSRTEFGLQIKNPRKLFSGHFPLDTQPQYWEYNLTGGAGIAEALSSNTRELEVTTTALTQGSWEMNTKQRFDCNNTNNRLIVALKPNLTGFAYADSYIDIGMGDGQTGASMDFYLRLFGNDVYRLGTKLGLSGQSTIVTTPISGSRTSIMTFVFDFNNYRIRLSQIFEGELITLAEKFNSTTSTFPHHMNFRPIIRVTQSVLDPGYTMKIRSIVLTQDAQDDMYGDFRAFHQSIGPPMTYVLATEYAITGIRYDVDLSTQADIQSVYVQSLDFLITDAGANWFIKLMRNPSIAGSQTWTSQTNSPVECLDGVLANTITGGEIVHCDIVENNYSIHKLNLPKPIQLHRGEELVVVASILATGGNGLGCINWIQY